MTSTSTVPISPLATSEWLTVERVIPGLRDGLRDHYKLVAGRTPSGLESTCLCCASTWGQHFDHLRFLVGKTVRVHCTEGGLKLRPLSEQPEEVQEDWIRSLQTWVDYPDTRADQLELDELTTDQRKRVDNAGIAGVNASIERLTALATTVAHLAHELGLATAMWVHLPSE